MWNDYHFIKNQSLLKLYHVNIWQMDIRRLYERGLSRDAILNLYKFIDWSMTLPEPLAVRYNDYIHQLEEEQSMAYITTAERIGMQKGFQQGIEQGLHRGQQEGEYRLLLKLLQRKFHAISETYQQKIQCADAETLLIWGERILDANNLDDIFK